MSHCYACDRLLTNREAARKHKGTKEEIGLCDKCLRAVEEVQPISYLDPYDAEELTELEEDLYGGFPTHLFLDEFGEDKE